MRCLKILTLVAVMAMFSSTVQAQAEAIFYIIGGLRGIGVGGGLATPDKIESRISDLKITDVNSLKDLPKIPSDKYIWYTGITAYNPVDFSDGAASIPKGLYTWNGARWINTYSAIPVGNLKGDLLALNAIQQHPDNKMADTKGYHVWNIDLENIDNPENLKLSGVFFREINGEYRVEELNLKEFGFRTITITTGLEALAYCKFSENERLRYVTLKLPSLIHLVIEGNKMLSTLSLNCSNLASAYIKNNTKQYSLSVVDCPKLYFLSVLGSSLATIDVSKNTELTYLQCYSNPLASLDVSKNAKLRYLGCHHNLLTALDVTQNKELRALHCSVNKIAVLDLSNNTALQELGCSENQLEELNVSNNTDLRELWCNLNRLKELDLSKNTHLTTIECSQNLGLAKLDVSSCVELKSLKCAENKLKLLDLSRQKKLEELDFYLSDLLVTPNAIKICRTVLEKATESTFNPVIKGDCYQVVSCD